MYGMTGKLTAQDGSRDTLVKILLQAAKVVSALPGCRAYLVAEDTADQNAVWVFEVWDDRVAHDESLKQEAVRSLIAEARPILAGPPEGAELNMVGGYGLPGMPE